MKKCRYRMFYIRYRIMPISNKPTISNVLGCYDIVESTISALKSYIDIVALCFDIVALCFDIECASILNDSGGPGSCRAADRDCRLQFGFVGTGLWFSEDVFTPAARGQAAPRGPGGGAQHEHKRGQARPRAGPRLRWRRVSATKFAHHSSR